MRAYNLRVQIFAVSFALVALLSGCERMVTSRNTQKIKEADWKAAQGDYLWAINLYEAALDGTPQSAEVHYKLALLYDDKLNDPLQAMHHFKRYLVLNPEGSHAAEVKDFMHRDEVALGTTLSGDSVVTRAEAARLRNENLRLHKEIDAGPVKPRPVADKSPSHHGDKEKAKGGHTYTVKDGDTLASISRKFYKTSKRWREIRDANENKIDDAANLKAGTTLTIPAND
ncbi:MAG TPA: LysM peptidoglycan-binding domain-containing protein [Chthoniobacterales bacterium]|jgi:LysM repeat protein|nr:LysM peptidoglycan-binding domain-containing protein [Chthoniobacterales bacterium]